MTAMPDIGHIHLRDRPLIVCDIDEIVLEFLTPFTAYLRANGHDLLPRSFRLHGNIVSLPDGSEADNKSVDAFMEGFFSTHDQWQTPAEHAVETLMSLSDDADIVFLTAMPPRHQDLRRAVLDRIGLDFPMIATEQPKGPVVARLHGQRTLPVAFLDDIHINLLSVRQHVPECLLVTFMANAAFRAFVPPPPEGIVNADDWIDAARLIRDHLGKAEP